MTTLMPVPQSLTANERLKESFGARVWLSLILATLLHVLPFRFMPDFTVPDWSPPAAAAPQVIQMGDVPIPDEPVAPDRPAIPIISADVAATATMPTMTWAEAREFAPPPVVQREGTAAGDGIAFVPYTLAPTLLNPDAVQRALRREYPAALRDAGMGGVVDLLVHIDTQGAVTEMRIGGSSGLASLDAAALRVADVMRFRPAMNRDVTVAVWIQLPVTFQVR